MDKMEIARGRLALFAGFWIGLASKMQWKAGDPQGGVAMTNGQEVVYNKENMDARPIGEVVYIALHEIGHPMLCHLTRRGNRNPKIYGAAIDIVLNSLLDKIAVENTQLKMTIPKDALKGAHFGIEEKDITTVEAVYNILYKQCKKQAKKDYKDGKRGEDGDGLDTSGIPSFDEHGEPKNADGKPMTGAQQQALEKDWKVAVHVAATMAKQMGKLPGFLEEFIGELIKPKVDWRAELRDCMAHVSRDESSYRRFNRRHLSRRTYLPGMYSERIGRIAYFCDTSGSISSDEFKAGMGAMTDILEDLKPEAIAFGQCDTTLHSVQELKPEDLPLPALKIMGRGGTDMREAFEWACEQDHDIEAFILQTDAYVPPLDPALIPNVPVILIVTTDAELPSGYESFRVVRIQL